MAAALRTAARTAGTQTKPSKIPGMRCATLASAFEFVDASWHSFASLDALRSHAPSPIRANPRFAMLPPATFCRGWEGAGTKLIFKRCCHSSCYQSPKISVTSTNEVTQKQTKVVQNHSQHTHTHTHTHPKKRTKPQPAGLAGAPRSSTFDAGPSSRKWCPGFELPRFKLIQARRSAPRSALRRAPRSTWHMTQLARR